MSNNEVMEYENFLNSNLNGEAWRYIDWNSLQPMFDVNKDPVSLVAFQSKHGAGIDPYHGLPYEKYLYFIRPNQPRNNPKNFIDGSGQELLEAIQNKCAKEIADVIPKIAYTKKAFSFVVPPEPPVVEGRLNITFGCSFEPSNGSVAKIMELEGSQEGLKIRAHGAYESIISSFTLDIGTYNGKTFNAGIKSSVLTGSFNGEFTTQAKVAPIPGTTCIKVTAGSSYSGKEKLYMNDVEWTLEYSLEYEVEATINKNQIKQAPERVRVPVRQPETNSLWQQNMTKRDFENSWLDKTKDSVTVGIGTGIFIGVALVLSSGILEGVSFGAATPVAASMTVLGITMIKAAN